MEEYTVECIITHKFQGKRRSLRDIRFRIRWVGWGSEFDSWCTYKEVSDLEALDIYLSNHQELHDIIPYDMALESPVKEGGVAAEIPQDITNAVPTATLVQETTNPVRTNLRRPITRAYANNSHH